MNSIKDVLGWLGKNKTILEIGGGLLAGGLALKGIDGLLGGIPGKLLGGALGGAGIGVQKVFVVNMGGGLGGGLPKVGGGLLQRGTEWFKNIPNAARTTGSSILGKLGMARNAVLDTLVKTRLGFSLLAARVGTNLGTLWTGLATRFTGLLGVISSNIGSLVSGVAVRFTGLLGSLGSSLTGLGASLGGGLSALGGSVLGKLGLAAAAFGVGWEIGTQLNKLEIGKNLDGTKQTVEGALQNTFGNMFFGKDQTDAGLIQTQAQIAHFQMLRKRNMQAGELNGQAYGQGLQQGLQNSSNSINLAGAGLGNQADLGTRRSLQIKSPSRVGRKTIGFYGQGLSLGLKDQISPVQRAAQTLAAAVAISSFGFPAFAVANQTDIAGVSSGAGISSFGAAGGLPPISVQISFGDIIVNGADPKAAQQTALAIKATSQEGAEQGLLNAIERMAARIGGLG